MREFEKLYYESRELALREVEHLARQILIENPAIDEFVMAMGEWFFTDKITKQFESLTSLTSLIDEWDYVLKLTGEPMRFTATGDKITYF